MIVDQNLEVNVGKLMQVRNTSDLSDNVTFKAYKTITSVLLSFLEDFPGCLKVCQS